MKQRLHYLDLAKGILMCLVVFHHFPYVLTNLDSSYNIEIFQSLEILYTPFFMGAFFMITGMTFHSTDIKSFLRRNVQCLIVPGILLTVICDLCRSFILCTDFKINPIGLLLGGGGYWWFLLSLFTAKFIVNVLMVYVKRLKRIVIITFLLSLSVCILRIFGFHSNPGFIQQSLVLTPYLVLGYVVRTHQEWFRRKFLLLVYCLAVISVLLFKLDYPCMTMIIMLDACNILPFFLLSYSGCLLFLVLSKKINKNYIFEEIGKNSLYIYLVHITVMYACTKVLFLFGVRNLFFLMPFAVLSSICISYGIAMLINYTKSLCYDKRYSK